MAAQTYRIYNAGYVKPSLADDLDSAAKHAREMCETAEASSVIAELTSGKTVGGCDIDAQTGLPISYLF